MFDPSTWETLLEQQRELEDACVARGGERFRSRLQQAKDANKASTVGAAKRLLLRGLTDLETALKQFTADADNAGPGRRHIAVKWVKEAGHDTVAYLTLKAILDGIEQRRPLHKVSQLIVDLLLDELKYRRFETTAPGLYRYKMAHFTTSSYAHMARALNASMRFADIDTSDLKLSPNHTALVGAKLVDLLIHSTGLVEMESTQSTVRTGRTMRPKTELMIQPTEATAIWLRKGNEALEFLSPVNLPMVVPPLQWEQGVRGGYRFALRNKYALVRGSRGGAPSKAVKDDYSMPLVYQAVNAIQNTAWKINGRVLETIEGLQAMGGGTAGIPFMDKLPLPAKPQDIADNTESRRAWRKKAHLVKTEDAARYIRCMEFLRVFKMAQSVKDHDAIFFPHNVDFRGRIYPVSTFLSPQGDDMSKGLLTFSQGKPIGSEGARWLAIHGANVLGESLEGEKVSKMTMDERVALTHRYSAAIIEAASAPLDVQWWTTADEPLQFLAFCFEWANYMKEGDTYVCTLPVSVDGSCNGLQHFSAMLRDEIGGAAVNVVPQDRPQDIYQRIADHVGDQLEKTATEDTTILGQLAGLWLSSGLLTRNLTKRPTMTFGYGSKPYGFQTQLSEYLQKQEEWNTIREHFTIGEDQVYIDACAQMSQCIWLALQETVVAAAQGMAWLQRCARHVSKEGKPITWSVPATGFPVVQEYFTVNKQQITTMLAGRVIRPAVYSTTPTIDTHKQVNAIAPNVVHSLDAAALMLTVARAMNDGVETFAAIHDSYGTIPADMPILVQATRESFVSLYRDHDVVSSLLSQFAGQSTAPLDIPEPPKKGNLDVSAVLASTYFFS